MVKAQKTAAGGGAARARHNANDVPMHSEEVERLLRVFSVVGPPVKIEGGGSIPPFIPAQQRNARANAVAQEFSIAMNHRGYDCGLAILSLYDWKNPGFASIVREYGFELLGVYEYSGDRQPDDEVNFAIADGTIVTFKKIAATNKPLDYPDITAITDDIMAEQTDQLISLVQRNPDILPALLKHAAKLTTRPTSSKLVSELNDNELAMRRQRKAKNQAAWRARRAAGPTP